MYTALRGTSRQSTTNHVCLACRRQLLANYQRAQRSLATVTEGKPTAPIHDIHQDFWAKSTKQVAQHSAKKRVDDAPKVFGASAGTPKTLQPNARGHSSKPQNGDGDGDVSRSKDEQATTPDEQLRKVAGQRRIKQMSEEVLKQHKSTMEPSKKKKVEGVEMIASSTQSKKLSDPQAVQVAEPIGENAVKEQGHTIRKTLTSTLALRRRRMKIKRLQAYASHYSEPTSRRDLSKKIKAQRKHLKAIVELSAQDKVKDEEMIASSVQSEKPSDSETVHAAEPPQGNIVSDHTDHHQQSEAVDQQKIGRTRIRGFAAKSYVSPRKIKMAPDPAQDRDQAMLLHALRPLGKLEDFAAKGQYLSPRRVKTRSIRHFPGSPSGEKALLEHAPDPNSAEHKLQKVSSKRSKDQVALKMASKSENPIKSVSHEPQVAVPYDNTNFGVPNAMGGLHTKPVLESQDLKHSDATNASTLTQDKHDQGFGLSKLQRQLSGTQAEPSSLIGNLRKRFFLPGKGKQEVPSPFEAMEPSPKFADIERANNEKASEVEETSYVPMAEKVAGPAATLNMPAAISINASDLRIKALDIKQPQVPKLSFGLDRVLFNSGVVQLQDPYSRVYNFDPYLQKIMPVQDFDFNALKQYKTSSEDRTLSNLAKQHDKTYVGSTSSMTSTLAHFHYLLSHHRNINVGMLSRDFSPDHLTFTRINRAPSSIFLRWQDGTYAIDADKEWDSPNVLMMLGKSMEKLLTMPKDDYERYRKSDPREVTAEQREEPEAFQYTTMGDMLMRSQLDAYDPRLPGNGTFDLKTRAVVSIRMDARDYESMLGYELLTLQGDYESYEREYFDMIRSTMLKYMLQARMGRMDGIFLAYHNIERLFGFQYLPIPEIDRAIHGQISRCLGDQEFKLSVRMMNDVLNAATARFPKRSLRIMFETEGESNSELVVLRVFAEPVDDAEIDKIQNKSKAANAAYEEQMMGIIRDSPDDAKTIMKEMVAAESKDKQDSSDESIDVDFVQSLVTQNKQPLFSALVLVESSVNNEIVVRPVNLQESDKWVVNYSMIELDDSRLDEAWSFYAQAKARKKAAFAFTKDEDGEGPKEKKSNAYMDRLRSFVTKGRKYRKRIDAAEAGQVPVVWKP